MVYQIYVERRMGHDAEAKGTLADLKNNLLIPDLTAVRFINRYFVEGIARAVLEKAALTVFSEPQTDTVSEHFAADGGRILTVEYLPGQYDQRADSCEQCIQILADGVKPKVQTARIYVLYGDISEEEFIKIKNYIINPVESREASLDVPQTLDMVFDIPNQVAVVDGFLALKAGEYALFAAKWGLAMDADDVAFCLDYFKTVERRNPTMTELRLIDSYWSDHCRHTTFLTSIEDVEIEGSTVARAYQNYLSKRGELYAGRSDKPITLMDIATIGAKYLKKVGALKNLDESEEINACSVKIKVDVDGDEQDWLLMFKNETHNHPTEIEPFGGAATCLGGAIRDPLSGRAYVYQAMRVTGAGDPRVPVADTMPGKLPQSRLTVTAANGYSSYGNQIGLATGGVYELYHPGYVAKRLEIGAVVGAAPAHNVVRENPSDGDIIVLLGGRTGRDGCGGATGSSKAHTAESLTTCGAEVQKGNPPEERKIQRLFRDSAVTRLIKRCNDFGAGGVSVAVGELADGLEIDLSKVPKKYEGLDGTELAISESQERMAVVLAPENVDTFIKMAERENLEATVIARVTAEPRLKMRWNGKTIVNISREFLNSNGAKKRTSVKVKQIDGAALYAGLSEKLDFADIAAAFEAMAADLNVCSQKGLAERFDSSIGAATIVMPFGGRTQLTAPQYMAAKIPVLEGDTDTASVMAYGFNPYLSEKSPFHGAFAAVAESVAKLVAAGIDYRRVYLTLQEYFERLRDIPVRWGKPFSALLGALTAQLELGVAAIGGKDSMSGSFETMDVPPTLVSFAIAASDAKALITPEFKKAGSRVYVISPCMNSENNLPDFGCMRSTFAYIHTLAQDGKLLSAYAVGFGGIAEAVVKMCFGNTIGFAFEKQNDIKALFENKYVSFVVEAEEILDRGVLLGHTTEKAAITLNGTEISLSRLEECWKATLEKVFPTVPKSVEPKLTESFSFSARPIVAASEKFARPRVIIPVFPGTNCEYDTMRAFSRAGGAAQTFVLRNLSSGMLEESLAELAALIDQSQIMMLPGGFSGGDEPDGSGKFITAVLRSPIIKQAVTNLLEKRGGLMLGICNGFQALVKSGLLPYGKIMDTMTPDCATLTFNAIKRHQSMMVTTRIATLKSPWLAKCGLGELHTIPISHGEGRFTASEQMIRDLAANGQIATQYTDLNGVPTMEVRYNPNSSDYAIEGIVSPDGRILGKMGHSERIGANVAKNIPGNKNQHLFECGVEYFK